MKGSIGRPTRSRQPKFDASSIPANTGLKVTITNRKAGIEAKVFHRGRRRYEVEIAGVVVGVFDAFGPASSFASNRARHPEAFNTACSENGPYDQNCRSR